MDVVVVVARPSSFILKYGQYTEGEELLVALKGLSVLKSFS